MPVRALIAFIVTLLVTLTLGSAAAETRFAFIIGNSAYPVSPLANPVNDATDVAAELTRLSFDVTLKLDAKAADLDAAFAAFRTKTWGADVALIYYAGHGMQFDRQNWLLPIDTNIETADSLRRSSISLQTWLHDLEGGARINLIFLDACRTGNQLAERFYARQKSTGRNLNQPRGLGRPDAPESETMIVYATEPDHEAADGTGRNSPFTQAFLANVATPGVEVESLMKRVTRAVERATNGEQKPERLSGLDQDFYFVPPQAAVPTPVVAVPVVVVPAPPAQSTVVADLPPAEKLKPTASTADPGKAAELKAEGDTYKSTKDYSNAMLSYRKAADLGNIEAMSNVGDLYYYGNGTPKNYANAMLWYRKAADLGNAEGIKNIGILYHTGNGVSQNYVEAMRWYRKAANLGNAEAMAGIGQFYDEGAGVSQNYAEALFWYRKAADRGYAHAMYNIGNLYENGNGVKKNPAEAMRWYNKAADLNFGSAMYGIATGYANGDGVAKDSNVAVDWALKALRADNNDKSALEQLKRDWSADPSDFRMAFQKRLKAKQLYSGNIDGAWGGGMDAAIQKIYSD